MDVDRRRNCYNCRGFGHITQYYKERGNQKRVGQERRMNYVNNKNTSNLNGEENLIVLD